MDKPIVVTIAWRWRGYGRYLYYAAWLWVKATYELYLISDTRAERLLCDVMRVCTMVETNCK